MNEIKEKPSIQTDQRSIWETDPKPLLESPKGILKGRAIFEDDDFKISEDSPIKKSTFKP